MSSDHTLVIPTFNRAAMLRQLVAHYRERASSMRLLVLDSSARVVAEENAAALASSGALLRHAVFAETEPFGSKLAKGLALVETPYVSICGDDDLVFPDAASYAVEFLKANGEYACAHGLYLNFRQAGSDVHVAREYGGPSNEASHPEARIFRLFQKYESLFYAVFRTDDLRDIFAILPQLPTPHYKELFQSVATVIKGRVKRFPKVYAARRSGPQAEAGMEKWQTFYWFAKNPGEVVEGYVSYREDLWRFYCVHAPAPRVEHDTFHRILDLSHAVYFAAGCPPEYLHSTLQQYWPGDRYENVSRKDLFLRGPDVSRYLAALRHGIAAIWSIPYIAFLNYRARSFTLRLPFSMRGLAALPEFRDAYLELCQYMSSSGKTLPHDAP